MFKGADRRYSHHRPYTRARDVPEAPYMGDPEDRLASAFNDSYGLLAVVLRSEAFRSELNEALGGRGKIEPVVAQQLLDRYVASASDVYRTHLIRELTPVVNAGAAAGRVQVVDTFAKAGGLAVAPGLTPPPGRVRRPRPLPAYRPLLRIPTPRMRIQPARLGRTSGQVAQTYLDAVEALSLELVSHIDDTQRAGILVALDDAMRKGYDVDVTSMRIANMVGLDPRWQRAVSNFEQRLTSEGSTPVHVINQRVQDYSDWLRERRGIRIARTELMRGMNTGRLVGWHDQASSGLFDAGLSTKEWSSAPDACPDCSAMNGVVVVGIDTVFRTQHGDVVMPPAHPHCRCTAVIHPVHTTDTADIDPDQAAMDAATLNDPALQRLLASQPQ